MTNKERFISIAKEIDRPGADVDGLLAYLEETDFFDAPMTSNSFRNYAGGLCEQAVSRTDTLFTIYKNSLYDNIEENSLRIAGLFSDLGKINYFEKTVRNKKVYSPTGKKADEIGNFDWVAEPSYAIKDPQERFIFGTLGQNSERILTEFIPLSDEASSAIINLHADYENPNLNMASIYLKYPLAVFLNAADKIASFINTREDILPF